MGIKETSVSTEIKMIGIEAAKTHFSKRRRVSALLMTSQSPESNQKKTFQVCAITFLLPESNDPRAQVLADCFNAVMKKKQWGERTKPAKKRCSWSSSNEERGSSHASIYNDKIIKMEAGICFIHFKQMEINTKKSNSLPLVKCEARFIHICSLQIPSLGEEFKKRMEKKETARS